MGTYARDLIAEIERAAKESPNGLDELVYVTRNGAAVPVETAETQTITASYETSDEPAGIWLDTIEGD